MKKNFFILSLLFLGACGLYEENHRTVKYDLENGSQVELRLYELEYPLMAKTLQVFVNGGYLNGKYCEDANLRIFGNEIWSETVKQNDLSAITSGVVTFSGSQGQPTPYLCKYYYSKKKNGEWEKTDEWSAK